MRPGVAAMIAVALSLPGLARSQPGAAGTDVSPAIPVHPSVATVLQLPDEIVRAQIHDEEQFLVEGARSALYVRPLPGTPAGVEALLDVQTRTLHRVFRVRVVERAEDAARTVDVRAAMERIGDARDESPPVTPTLPPPVASASPAAAQPDAADEPAHTHAAPIAAPAAAPVAAGSSRFELFAHAVVALAGVTALEIAGYEPGRTLQSHRTLGLRLTGAPRGTWWAVEGDVIGEWLARPLVYVEDDEESQVAVSGPWFRAEVGMRARFGTRWIPSAYAGLGLQAQLRRTEKTGPREDPKSVETLEHGAVLALGMGLQYRVSKILLGLDFQVRQGGPDNYRSISAFWSVGCLLDQGE